MKPKQIDLIGDTEIQRGSPLAMVAQHAGQMLGQFKRLTKEHGGLLTPTQAGAVLTLPQSRIYTLVESGRLTFIHWRGKNWIGGNDVERLLKERLTEKAVEDITTNPKSVLAALREGKLAARVV